MAAPAAADESPAASPASAADAAPAAEPAAEPDADVAPAAEPDAEPDADAAPAAEPDAKPDADADVPPEVDNAPADAAKFIPFELKQQPAVAVEIETLELEQPPADAAKDIRPGWHPALTALLLTALCALVALLNLVNVLNICGDGYRSALCSGLIGSFCPSLSGSVFGLLGSILFICKESNVDAPRCRTAIAFVAIDQISSFGCFVAIVLMTMFYVEYPAKPASYKAELVAAAMMTAAFNLFEAVACGRVTNLGTRFDYRRNKPVHLRMVLVNSAVLAAWAVATPIVLHALPAELDGAAATHASSTPAANDSAPAFRVLHGRCEAVGGCVMSPRLSDSAADGGPGYPPDEDCEIEMPVPRPIYSVSFDTEECCDTLYVGAQLRFKGKNGPWGVVPDGKPRYCWEEPRLAACAEEQAPAPAADEGSYSYDAAPVPMAAPMALPAAAAPVAVPAPLRANCADWCNKFVCDVPECVGCGAEKGCAAFPPSPPPSPSPPPPPPSPPSLSWLGSLCGWSASPP